MTLIVTVMTLIVTVMTLIVDSKGEEGEERKEERGGCNIFDTYSDCNVS